MLVTTPETFEDRVKFFMAGDKVIAFPLATGLSLYLVVDSLRREDYKTLMIVLLIVSLNIL